MEKKRTYRAKQVWLSAGCALALICVGGAAAQDSAGASTTASTKPQTKSASSTAGKSSSASRTSSKSTHPAAHSSGKSSKSGTTSAPHSGKYTHASSRKSSKKKTARGQQKIDAERAQSIQEALIREHYLSGTAAGTWNQASEDAMRRYQADHGWQSKTVPDSRALISLGLGPSHDHLLNPDSAMTTEPPPTHAASLTPVSHSAEAGARVSTNPASGTPPTAASSDHDAPSPQ